MRTSQSALSIVKSAGFTEPSFEKFIKSKFSVLPKSFVKVVNERYIATFQDENIRAANLMLLDVADAAGGANGLMASNDAELCAHAKKCAAGAYRVASRFKVPEMALYYLKQHAMQHGIEPPNEKVSELGQRARLLCEKWWRRAIRKNIARKVERFAINLGMVHRQKCIYASDETVTRREQQKRRNENMLKTIIAVNELGQEYSLADLSALGVSNPEIRRKELMTRIAGFDELAQELGHAADFYTLTCPSKYHAIGQNGKPNKKYQGATPKEAQAYLSKTWAQTRAYLAKHGVKVYGFRVAEPHHDATPHWHMILFYEKQNKALIRNAMKHYFLKMDAQEFGADKHRCKVEAIDYSKGTAVGYLAKYISKNINGKNIEGEIDFEGGFVDSSLARVSAWAAVWGIRQFQQIGGAPVGVWREARRLGEVDINGLVGEVIAAADGAKWAEYTKLQGGAFVSRKDLKVRVYSIFNEQAITLYDGLGMSRIYGICEAGNDEIINTRLHEWVLKRAFTPAWSSVNNCNQVADLTQMKGENIVHTVRKWPQFSENLPAFAGAKDNETITDFDIRSFKNGQW